MNRILLRACFLAGMISLLLAGYEAYTVWRGWQHSISSAKSSALHKADQGAHSINTALARFVPLVDGLAEELSSGALPFPEIDSRLHQLMETHPELPAIGAAFEPYAYDRTQRLYAPYLMRNNQTVEQHRIERFYDYTKPGVGWYGPMLQQPGWDEPTWGKASGALMATYAAPFYHTDSQGHRTPAGVVYLSYPLDQISRWVEAINLGPTGWSLLLSKKGTIIARPGLRSTGGQANVFELARETGNETIMKAAERMIRGDRGTSDILNVFTGQTLHLFYEPIPVTGWSLGVLLVANEIPFDSRQFRRGTIRAYSLLLTAVILLSVAVSYRPYRSSPRLTLWSLVAVSSVLFVAGITLIRFLPQDQHNNGSEESAIIVDRPGLAAFLEDRKKDRGTDGDTPPIYVPAGLLVQSMEFTGSRSIQVSGLIWQEIPAEAGPGVSPGFILPEAVNTKVTEAYRREEGGRQTFGWTFEATLWQNVEYAKYPFDEVKVGVRVWHKDFYRNVILVPSLDAYTQINPVARPGIDQGLRFSGWIIQSSFYSFEMDQYGTDLGLPAYFGEETFPQLQFNVSLKRNLMDALITNMIPLAVVSLMLFAVLASFTKDMDRLKAVGFNPPTAMRVTSGLFFVVLLAHIHLRTTVAAQDVTYLEYYYFTMYIAILAISFHSFLMATDKIPIGCLDYEHSLIPKLLFWPLLLGTQFVITVLVFY